MAREHDEYTRAAHDDEVTVHDDRVIQGDRVVADDTLVEREMSTGFYRSPLTRVNAVLWALLTALEALLGLRFLLLAFGANRANDFVDFVLDVSWPFVRPFDGAFANRTWDEGIIEINTLLAMGVYLLAAALLSMLLMALWPRGGGDARHVGVTRRSITHHQ
jgi:hypothetical protein